MRCWILVIGVAGILLVEGCSSTFQNGEKAFNSGNFAKALQILLPIGERGDARAQLMIGSIYANGVGNLNENYEEAVPIDLAKAVGWYRKAASQGNAEAQFRLGFSYDIGKGIPEDHTEAVKWYRKGADQGNADAEHYLALSYECGCGIAMDKVLAVKWLRKAADQGDARAQHDLGVFYELGKGVPKDTVEAAKWYQKAANAK
jgi:TPR repeat protein